MAGDVEAFHFGIAHLDAFHISPRVERAGDLQSGLGGRSADQRDDGDMIHQGMAAPVLGDVTEQTVLDLVPLCAAET